MDKSQLGAQPLEPIPTSSEGFGGWLSIAEAVIHCTNAGLPRTSKTIRKWAVRAHADADEAEITARREDTENGFRWMVYLDWLDCRIAEELEFEARKRSEQVRTGDNPSEPVSLEESALLLAEPSAHPSEPVDTGTDASAAASVDFLRHQMEEKDRQISELNDQIKRKDEQIMTMLERDRETNILIKGLQGTLERTLGLDVPNQFERGDSREQSNADGV